MTYLNDNPGFRPALDDHIYEFDGLSEALQALPKGQHFGKIAVRIS